jgi:hypothetical protein
VDGRPVVFKRRKDVPDWVNKQLAEQERKQKAELELARQAMMANLTATAPTYTTYGGQFNTNTIAAGTTYTTASYTSSTTGFYNWPPIPVDPDKYVSPNDAANRAMQLRDQFGWNDLKPSIRGKRFNHYGLEWRMI